jgi:hypothetical protein
MRAGKLPAWRMHSCTYLPMLMRSMLLEQQGQHCVCEEEHLALLLGHPFTCAATGAGAHARRGAACKRRLRQTFAFSTPYADTSTQR